MIIKLKIYKLKNMLNSVIGIIKNKKKESIFSYLLIKVIKNKIFLIAVNEEIELVTYDEYENYIENLDIILKFDFLYEICKRANNDDDIFIKKNKNIIEIKLSELYFKFLNTLTEKFPNFEDDENIITKFKIESKSLNELFSCILITLFENNFQDFLNGAYMEINENIITTFSSDGNRFTYSYSYVNSNNKNINVIIPKQTINEIIKLTYLYKYIYIVITKKYIKFITKSITLSSKLINDIYELPDLELDQNLFNEIKLKKNFVKNSLYKINFLIREKKVSFLFKENEITIFTEFNNESGYINIKIDQFLNNEFLINLNIKYFIDILKYISGDVFILNFSNNKNFVIINEKNRKYIYTMIPI